MSDLVFFFITYLVMGVIIGSFTSTVAKAKGYNEIMWSLGGFFFSFVALIAIAGMPVKQSATPPKN